MRCKIKLLSCWQFCGEPAPTFALAIAFSFAKAKGEGEKVGSCLKVEQLPRGTREMG